MSESAAPPDASELRRIHSMGDIPRPQSAHAPERRSEGRAQSPSGQTSSPFTGPLGTVSNPAPPSPGTIIAQQHPVASHPNQNLGRTARLLAYFGLGRNASRARRSLVALIFNLVWGFTQIVVISTVIGLSGTVFMSTTKPELTEWDACDKPLGVWAALWVVREALSIAMAYWDYVRARQLHAATADAEAGTSIRPAALGSGNGSGAHSRTPTSLSGTASIGGTTNAGAAPPPTKLPFTELYTRLTFLSTLMMLIWFLVAHILEYTSVETCRISSPHVWWLNFGILCIMYFMILEVLVLGIIVFIIAPVIFLIWNITLILLGRHPLQNPGMINPEIGKLSKAVVDKIPLVMYIPPPPESLKDTITIPPSTHSYPPKALAPKPPRRRFRFLRLTKKPKEIKTHAGLNDREKAEDHNPDPNNWEDHWEQVGYPFVVLEGNRAACAICLMDFEEPKRIIAPEDPLKPAEQPSDNPLVDPDATSATGAPQKIPVEPITEEEQQDLKLEDAGEGAQPLRLLACGHVFHKTCLDPWLTDVSGRCPVCQRAVESPEIPKKTRRRRGGDT